MLYRTREHYVDQPIEGTVAGTLRYTWTVGERNITCFAGHGHWPFNRITDTNAGKIEKRNVTEELRDGYFLSQASFRVQSRSISGGS